jgi:dTDP-4-dehydrorhamnose 3,5-epimerase
MSENFREGQIKGVIVRKLQKFTDSRGWLAELFRLDELDDEFHPAMTYISATRPGVTRGPHEHVDQADLFCFIGPSNFKLGLWDNRVDSTSYRCVMTIFVGEDEPSSVLVPKSVVHAYQNIGTVEGIVINSPNRLYRGRDRKDAIDEIRHEDEVETQYQIGD